MLPSIVLLSIAVMSMGFLTSSIYSLYLMYFLIPLAGMATLPHSYSRVIVAWFRRKRGLALGISLAGIGAGASLVPVLVQNIIEAHGWRTAYFTYGMLILLISLPMTLFLLRENPEEMHLKPDGHSSDSENSETISRGVSGMTLGKSSTTISFWLIFFSVLLAGLILASMFVHLVPMLIDRGLSPTVAAYGAATLGISLIVGRILSGWLMDRYFAPYIAALFLGGLVFGIVLLATGTSSPFVFLAAVMIGLASGSEMSEIGYLISRYFGQLSFGKIYGVMLSAFQLGGAIGAPLMGAYFDRAGNYIGMLWFLAVFGVMSTILIASLKKYPNLGIAGQD